MTEFSTLLLDWFSQHGRHDLPWQKDITPYRVWLSEIMLQQTQVSTVIPYFTRFIKTLPTIDKLAKASDDEVLHLWSGLGYYSRARNLHKAAKIIVDDFAGQFPSKFEQIIGLPGIGRSTAGAICAIALQQHYAILDGNVKRILTRLHAIEGWPNKTSVSEQLWQIAEQHTPKHQVADYTQAIMDLGATICKRGQAICSSCPVKQRCKAYQQNRQAEFPHRKPRKILPEKQTTLLILQNQRQQLLMHKRPASGIWGGLWSFIEASIDDVETICQQYTCRFQQQQALAPFRHTFSHFHLDIHPVVVKVTQDQTTVTENDTIIWYDTQQPANIGLAAPVKKILEKLYVSHD